MMRFGVLFPGKEFLSKGQRRHHCDGRYRMNKITQNEVRQFLLVKYARSIKDLGLDPAQIPDSFDFLLSGVIDSFGILEMISSIEDKFRIHLDLATLDAEQITLLGPLSQYVAQNWKAE